MNTKANNWQVNAFSLMPNQCFAPWLVAVLLAASATFTLAADRVCGYLWRQRVLYWPPRINPIGPPSGLTQRLFQEPPAESKFLAA